MSLKNRKDLLVLAVFTLLAMFCFRNYFLKGQVPFPSNLLVSFYSPWKQYEWTGYPNGPANKPIGFDVVRLFYPFRKFTTEELKQGRIPLWNPYNFSGNVHLATYQTAVFYPLNLIYFILPQIDAWSVLVIIQPILSGFFTFLFLKEIRVSAKAAFFGAFTFAFSGWMIAWSEESLVIEHSALWLPLMLYGAERYLNRKNVRSLVILITALTFSIFAGFLQMTLYSFALTTFWFSYRLWQDKRKFKEALPIIFTFLLGFLISGVHLLSAIEAYFTSPRGIVDAKFLFDSYLMKPAHLITLIAPDFWGNPAVYNYFGSGFYHEKVVYLGIPAFLFALFALVFGRGKNVLFFKVAAIAALTLGFIPFGWLLYYSRLPLLSAIIPSRIFFISTFGFSILSAYGIEMFLNKEAKLVQWKKIFIFLACIFVGLWVFVFVEKYMQSLLPYGTVSLRNLILPTLFFVGSALMITFGLLTRKLSLFYYFVFLMAFLSSFYFANKFIYFSERRFVFPEAPVTSKLKSIAGIDRVWSYGNGYWEKNMNIFYGIYSPEGYDALFPQRYGELLNVQRTNGKLNDQIGRTDADIKFASEKDLIVDNPYRLRLMSLLGVKYVIESKDGEGKDFYPQEKRFPKNLFNKIWEDEAYIIWEHKKALPRAFLVHSTVVANDKQKAIEILFQPSFDLAQSVLLNEETKVDFKNAPIASGEAKITKYEPSRVEIETYDRSPSILFLSDNFDPGWKVSVDDRPEKIILANYSFRAVEIPPGKHKVIFVYKPRSYVLGVVTSVLGLLGFMLLLLSGKIFLRRR